MKGIALNYAVSRAAVLSKLLPDFPGKEVVMVTVTYPPGSSGPVHRHISHGFIYVFEGSVVMRVNGGEPLTLAPGQTFYEGPNDVHTIGRNASKTRPARFLVFLIKDRDAPTQVVLGTPFLTWSKRAVYDFCLKCGIPVELTWSCEVGPLVPCGRCLSCEDRGHLSVCATQ